MDLGELIDETKMSLHGLFKRPRLTDKLLSKPPFRFLHDLVSAITANTGFAEGLYNEAEQDTATITDKASKIVYLEKLILLVGICSGKAINVLPSKILAGLEPENTNRFLIALGKAVRNSKLDFQEEVRLTLVGGQPGTHLPLCKENQHHIENGAAAEAKTKTKVIVREVEEEEAAAAAQERKVGREDDHPDNTSQSTLSRKTAHLTRDGEDEKLIDRSTTFQRERERQHFYPLLNGNHDESKQQQETTSPLLLDMNTTCDRSFHMTRMMLEPIIKHPRLTDKLLGKPPFRFLHDIVNEVTRQSRFAEGLFEPFLLDSANVKDKATKILYLERIFALVGIQLNEPVRAKPTKVIAGLEPENTNHFLQLLGLAAQERPDSTAAVRQVLEDHGISVAQASPVHAVAEPKRGDGTNVSHFTTAEALQEKQGWEPREETVSRNVLLLPKEESKHALAMIDDSLREEVMITNGGEEKLEIVVDRRAAEGTIYTRLKTALRGPPLIRGATKGVEEKSMEVDPIYKQQSISIMADGDENDLGEDKDDKQLILGSEGSNPTGVRIGEERGHNPLDSAVIKDEEAMKSAAESKGNTDDTGSGIRLGKLHKVNGGMRGRKRSSNNTTTLREPVGGLEALRRTVEMLCRRDASLGYCMEYIYEDLTMMYEEREKWRKEWQFNQGKLEAEKEVTEEALQPLKVQLLELEEKIKEQEIKVNSVKATISHNDNKLLSIVALGIQN